MLISAENLIELTGGRLAQGMMPDGEGSISSDTRTMREGDWFIALHGKHYDGHDFIGDAFSRGAIGCIVEERTNYPIASTSFPLIAVGDTLDALVVLAQHHRETIEIPQVVLIISGEYSGAVGVSRVLKDISGETNLVTFDLAETGLGGVLSQMVELDRSVERLLVCIVPTSLEDMAYMARASQPHACLFLKEPFGGLRILADTHQIESCVSIVLSALRQPSLVLTQGEDCFSVASRLIPPDSIVRTFEREHPDIDSEVPSKAVAEEKRSMSFSPVDLSFSPISSVLDETVVLGDDIDVWAAEACAESLGWRKSKS